MQVGLMGPVHWKKRKEAFHEPPVCGRQLAGREIGEKLSRQNAGSHLAAQSHLFEVQARSVTEFGFPLRRGWQRLLLLHDGLLSGILHTPGGTSPSA